LLLDRKHSVALCPLTTHLTDATPLRILVRPNSANGLAAPSEIMVDKITAVPARRLGKVIGRLDDGTLSRLDLTLRALLDLA
jgi:mRNA interferase MazF